MKEGGRTPEKSQRGVFSKIKGHASGAAMVALLETFGMAGGAEAAEPAKVEMGQKTEVLKAKSEKIALDTLHKSGESFTEEEDGKERKGKMMTVGDKELTCIYDKAGKPELVIMQRKNIIYVDKDADGAVDRIMLTDAKGPDLAMLKLTLRDTLEAAATQAGIQAHTPSPVWRMFEFQNNKGETIAFSVDSKDGKAAKMTGDEAAKLRNRTTAAFDEALEAFAKK